MMACPDREQLELLLAKGLADTARDELEMHVEDCDACQQVLELLTEFSNWEPTRNRGGDPSQARNRAGELSVAAVGLQSLGGYRVEHELGRGGMGVVYEAEHESLKNRVALKVMHARFRDDRTYVRRFRIEAQSAAKLHHTNIVPVFDYGEQEGVFYYAMPFIAGVGLDRVLEDVRRLRSEANRDAEAWTIEAGPETATTVLPESTPQASIPAASHERRRNGDTASLWPSASRRCRVGRSTSDCATVRASSSSRRRFSRAVVAASCTRDLPCSSASVLSMWLADQVMPPATSSTSNRWMATSQRLRLVLAGSGHTEASRRRRRSSMSSQRRR